MDVLREALVAVFPGEWSWLIPVLSGVESAEVATAAAAATAPLSTTSTTSAPGAATIPGEISMRARVFRFRGELALAEGGEAQTFALASATRLLDVRGDGGVRLLVLGRFLSLSPLLPLRPALGIGGTGGMGGGERGGSVDGGTIPVAEAVMAAMSEGECLLVTGYGR